MILTAGELLSEFISHEKDCALERPSLYSGPYPSGAPAIFINQAARMGAEAQMVGTVGNDPFGRSIINRLRGDGVDVSKIAIHENLSTGLALVSYFSDGTRIFAYYIDGTAAEKLPKANLITSPTIFHISGASLSIPGLRDGIIETARAVKASGGRISYDPNIRPELLKDSDILSAVHELLEISDIFMPSEADFEVLFSDKDRNRKCRELVAGGIDILVYKMGAKGVQVYAEDEEFELPAFAVEEVDATGAGDCFCGAFIGLLDLGEDLRTAAKYANAAGAMHVTKRGPMEFNPSLEEIKVFVNEQTGP